MIHQFLPGWAEKGEAGAVNEVLGKDKRDILGVWCALVDTKGEKVVGGKQREK